MASGVKEGCNRRIGNNINTIRVCLFVCVCSCQLNTHLPYTRSRLIRVFIVLMVLVTAGPINRAIHVYYSDKRHSQPPRSRPHPHSSGSHLYNRPSSHQRWKGQRDRDYGVTDSSTVDMVS